jgi:hypothetical protein
MRKIVSFDCAGKKTQLQLPRNSLVRSISVDSGMAKVFVEVDIDERLFDISSVFCNIHLVGTGEEIPYSPNTQYIGDVFIDGGMKHCFASYMSLPD